MSDQEQLTEWFEYLDGLRTSGATNMFGAAPFLAEEFGITRGEAHSVLSKWMETFGDDSPAKRAALALKD